MKNVHDMIELKSSNDEFILNVKTQTYAETIKALDLKFKDEKTVKGLEIEKVNAIFLNPIEVQNVENYLIRKYKIKFARQRINDNKSHKKEEKSKSEQKKTQSKKNTNDEVKETQENNQENSTEEFINEVLKNEDLTGRNNYPTRVVINTMRSGSQINYDGNVLVIGDVNPGAQIIAKGNIVVMGALRGLAHAGAKGDKNSFVVAIHLEPTQLRISESIAIPPEDKSLIPKGVHMARIIDNMIVLEQITVKI